MGLYLGIHDRQLRWFSDQGEVIPLPEEQERQAREQEQQAKEQEWQRAEAAEQRAERLAALLRSQGIDPEQRQETTPKFLDECVHRSPIPKNL